MRDYSLQLMKCFDWLHGQTDVTVTSYLTGKVEQCEIEHSEAWSDSIQNKRGFESSIEEEQWVSRNKITNRPSWET